TMEKALELVKNKQDEHKILFLKSWNEWAEGNYVEPDLRFGHGYLDAIRDCVL
ncbi:MAG: glycoside hydrolase family 99-like domain-containing protein, partial [Bacteroidaceae bacterium]|nr:glycoside hydrolase family 99-like domain-containing protein [Bacteroidaceae bacterium]